MAGRLGYLNASTYEMECCSHPRSRRNIRCPWSVGERGTRVGPHLSPQRRAFGSQRLHALLVAGDQCLLQRPQAASERRPDLGRNVGKARPIAYAFDHPSQPLFCVVQGQLQLTDLCLRPAAGRKHAGKVSLDNAATELHATETSAQIFVDLSALARCRYVLERDSHGGDGGGSGAIERPNALAQRPLRVIGQKHELPQPEADHAGHHGEHVPGQVAPSDARAFGEVQTHGQHQEQLAGAEPAPPHHVGCEDQHQQDRRIEPGASVQQTRHQQRQDRHRRAQHLRPLSLGAPSIDDDQRVDEADRDGEQPYGRHRSIGEPYDDQMHGQPGGQRRQRGARALVAAQCARVGGVEPVAERTPPTTYAHSWSYLRLDRSWQVLGSQFPQHALNLRPLPHGHGSLRPVRAASSASIGMMSPASRPSLEQRGHHLHAPVGVREEVA